MVHRLCMNKTVIKNKTEGTIWIFLFYSGLGWSIGTIDINEPSWEAYYVVLRGFVGSGVILQRGWASTGARIWGGG